MKRVILVGVLGAMLLTMAVGYTAQAIVQCTGGICRGTPAGDSVTGSAIRDIIYLGGGDDVADGKQGNDTIHGSSGADRISGGPGGDAIYGGAGDDILIGNGGQDFISGGEGNDRIIANEGNRDRITCGGGFDTVRADAKDVVDRTCESVTRT